MESEKDFHVGEWLVRRQLNTIENGTEVRTIEPKVMEVLVYLAEHAGQVLPKERIIQAVWPDTFVRRHFLFVAVTEKGERKLCLGSLDSPEIKSFFTSESPVSPAVYSPPGYLLFVHQNSLMAQSFDPEKLTLTGEPSLVVEGIAEFGGAKFSVSQNGVLAYQPARFSELVWLDRDGKRLGDATPSVKKWWFRQITLSPDGKHVATERRRRDGISGCWNWRARSFRD